MTKAGTVLQAILSAFSSPVGVKEPSRAWEHDDQRLSRADEKRLRKNAARLRSRNIKQGEE